MKNIIKFLSSICIPVIIICAVIYGTVATYNEFGAIPILVFVGILLGLIYANLFIDMWKDNHKR